MMGLCSSYGVGYQVLRTLERFPRSDEARLAGRRYGIHRNVDAILSLPELSGRSEDDKYLKLQVLIVLSILGSCVLRVDASSRRRFPEGLIPVQLSEHKNFEPAPSGSLVTGESDRTELHLLQREQGDVSETLRTFRPRPRFLAAAGKREGKTTPTGAPPPPKIKKRFALPPPPSPLSIPPPPPRKYRR